LVLASNNIINVQTEWPLSQRDFDRFMLEKYSTYDNLFNGVHHYETTEVKNSKGVVIVPAGLKCESDYSVSFFDNTLQTTLTSTAKTVTNYQYEEDLENKKRNIFLLKPQYINVAIDDLEEMMVYEKGSTQYKSETLKRADNIRLYE